MARMRSGTKAAAKSASAQARLFVPGAGAAKKFGTAAQEGSKLLRDVAGQMTTGPFKELFQGQARAGLGGTPKKKKRP